MSTYYVRHCSRASHTLALNAHSCPVRQGCHHWPIYPSAVGAESHGGLLHGGARSWGCCLQAACRGGRQCCCLRSPAQAQFGVDGVGMSPVLRALGLGTSHVTGGALGGQGRGFWAGPAQPLRPLCQGIPRWARLRGEQLIVLEEAGDRNILRTGDNRFLLIWK